MNGRHFPVSHLSLTSLFNFLFNFVESVMSNQLPCHLSPPRLVQLLSHFLDLDGFLVQSFFHLEQITCKNFFLDFHELDDVPLTFLENLFNRFNYSFFQLSKFPLNHPVHFSIESIQLMVYVVDFFINLWWKTFQAFHRLSSRRLERCSNNPTVLSTWPAVILAACWVLIFGVERFRPFEGQILLLNFMKSGLSLKFNVLVKF